MERESLTYRLSYLMNKITTNHVNALVFVLKYQLWSKSTQCLNHEQMPGMPYENQRELDCAVKKHKYRYFNRVASNVVASNAVISRMKEKESKRVIKKRRKLTN